MLFPRLKNLVLTTAVLFFLQGLAQAQSGKVVPTPTPVEETGEKVSTEEIKINISAFDRYGEFFAGVRSQDLVISEDGVLHQPTSVRRIPANVLIVLDTGGEDRSAKDFKTTRETAKMLIKNLQPEDSIALLEYHDTAQIIAEWTTDKTELLTVLDKKLKFGKRSRFVEALNLAVNFFAKSGADNRHLVLISDGLDSSSNDGERESALRKILSTDINVHIFSYTKLEQSVVESRRKNITFGDSPRKELPPGADIPIQGRTKTRPIVTVNTDREMMRKIKERGAALEKSEKSLTELSENTNGILFLPETREEMIEKTEILAKNIDSQYVVTYTPKRSFEESKPDEVRSIQVTSKRDGLDVQGRRKLMVSVKP